MVFWCGVTEWLFPQNCEGEWWRHCMRDTGHTVKMKGLARGYVWWPLMDEDIEDVTKRCEGCKGVANNPKQAPLHRWEYPAYPWQRLHIDFAGPFQEKNLGRSGRTHQMAWHFWDAKYNCSRNCSYSAILICKEWVCQSKLCQTMDLSLCLENSNISQKWMVPDTWLALRIIHPPTAYRNAWFKVSRTLSKLTDRIDLSNTSSTDFCLHIAQHHMLQQDTVQLNCCLVEIWSRGWIFWSRTSNE